MLRIDFAIQFRLGFYRFLIGQLDSGDGSELFLSPVRGYRKGLALRIPLHEPGTTTTPPKPPSRFCSSCGAARATGARFCGSCGTAFVETTTVTAHGNASFRSTILSVSRELARPAESGSPRELELEKLHQTIFSVTKHSIEAHWSHQVPEEVTSYLNELEGIFADKAENDDITVVQIIDASVTESNLPLTMGLAQYIAQKAENGEAFGPREEAGLAVLLTEAPFTFGYWGPFKKVLKTVDPSKYPEQFAVATERLLAPTRSTHWRDDAAQFEDVSGLAGVMTVASPDTRHYMARQQLRRFQDLAETAPETVVAIATRYLLARESGSPRDDIVEAYFLNGSATYRDKWSRRSADLSPDMEFAPPATPGWDQHPDYLTKLWTSVKRRGDFQSFAFQGLVSRGALLPELSGEQLSLALRSGYGPLVSYAIDEAVNRPETWKSLRSQEWYTLLGQVDQTTRETMLSHQSLPLPAIEQFLTCGDNSLSFLGVSRFIARWQEWKDSGYSLSVSLWRSLLANGDAPQIEQLVERMISLASDEKYVPTYMRHTATALDQVITEDWNTHPAVSTLAFQVLHVSEFGRLGTPTTEALARAIFVLGVYRTFLGDHWMASWRELATADSLVQAIVLLNSQGAAAEAALDARLRGGTSAASQELQQLLADKISAQTSPGWALNRAWTTFANETDLAGGLGLLRLLPTGTHFAAALRVVSRDENRTLQERARLSTEILALSDGGSLENFRASLAEEPQLWQELDFGYLLAQSGQLRRALWALVGAEQADAAIEEAVAASPSRDTLFDELSAEDFAQPADAQVRLLVNYLSQRVDSIGLGQQTALAAATSQNTDIARWGIKALKAQDVLSQVWLTLVESELPIPFEEGFAAVARMKDPAALTDAVIMAVDSPVANVRRRGLSLIDNLEGRLDTERLFLALSQSEAPEVQNRVAEEALVASWSTRPEVDAFDDHVLTVRRRSRRAKEFVKQRLGSEALSGAPSAERISVLVDLARYGKPRDAEWAQQRLAHLALAGVEMDSVTVSEVSEGAGNG